MLRVLLVTLKMRIKMGWISPMGNKQGYTPPVEYRRLRVRVLRCQMLSPIIPAWSHVCLGFCGAALLRNFHVMPLCWVGVQELKLSYHNMGM